MLVLPRMFSFTGGGLSANIVLDLRLSVHFDTYLPFLTSTFTVIILHIITL